LIKKKQLQVIKVITDIEVNKNSKDPKDESTTEKHENEKDTAITNDEKKSNIIQNSKK